jgi:hypothetical protein
MIKIISIFCFVLIWFGLNRLKKIKYPDSKSTKINLFKRYFFVPIVGFLFGIIGAIFIGRYPNFDTNLDLPFIGFIFLYLLIDESIDFLILNGKGDWFLANNKKV